MRRAISVVLVSLLLASIPLVSEAEAVKWLFKDGFESGNTSKWTSSQGVTVFKQASQAFSGSWVARATAAGSPAYVSKTLAATKVELFARIRFKIESQSTDADVLSFRTATGTELLSVGRTAAGALFTYNNVTSTMRTGATSVSINQWHEVMVHVHLDDDTTRWEVFFDHTEITDLGQLGMLGTTPIGQIRAGEPRSGRTVTMLLDDGAYDDKEVDDTTPSIPTGLAQQSVTAAAATISWNANPAIDAVDRYSVYRNGTFLTATNEDETTFTDLTVTPGQTYQYSIDAVDNFGNQSAKTGNLSVGVPNPSAAVPGVPTGLAIDVPVADQISLTWDPNPAGDEVRTYRVFRDGDQVGTVTGADLYFIDVGLTPSTAYNYKVQAEDVGGLLSAKTLAVQGTTTTANVPTVWWGVATHKEGSKSDQQVRKDLEADIGRDFVAFRKYANWTQAIPSGAQKTAWNNEGIMPFTAWTTYVKGAGDLTYADIASGARDAEIRAKARQIRDSGIPMFFTFQHEPEDGQGSTDPQAGPPSDYIAAFIRIHDIFQQEGANNLTWVNTLTLASFKESKGKTAEAWSPPPQYYDYVGVDGYVRWPCVQWDGRPFFSFRDTFAESYAFAESLGKPLFIGEIGIIEQTECGNTNGDPNAKADWFEEARAQMKAWPLVIGVAWTHATVNFLDKFPLDYHVDSTPQSMAAFTAMGHDPYFGKTGAS